MPPHMDIDNSPPDQFRRTQIRRAKMSIHLLLPQEIIEEILAILRVRSLLKFRCVSKSWRSLIDSRFFIKKHLQKSTQTWLVTSNQYTNHGIKKFSERSDLEILDLDPSPINDPTNEHLTTAGVTVVGSCNGLLCILKQKSFFLWNPTTRLSIELPKIPIRITKYGFGWDEQTDAYKVFAITESAGIGKVYSSKTNSWKTVEHGCLSLYREHGVFACGKIHWLTKCGRHIESFDLKSEAFGMMEQPCKPDAGRRQLNERYGCLSMICDNNGTQYDVWIMEKYGVWVKKNSAPIPLAFRYKSNYAAFFNRGDEGVKFLPVNRIVNCAVDLYIESLVSPVDTLRQEIEQEQIHSVRIAEGCPKPQNKRRAVEGAKNNQEIDHEQIHTRSS